MGLALRKLTALANRTLICMAEIARRKTRR
jgi:hypothetical protein